MDVTLDVEIDRPGATLLLAVAAEVEADTHDWMRRRASVASVSVERVTCAGCGQSVALSPSEAARVEDAVEAAAEKQLERERGDALEDCA